MYVKVRFKNSLKSYTYHVKGKIEPGLYYLPDKQALVVVLDSFSTEEPTFEVVDFEGIHVFKEACNWYRNRLLKGEDCLAEYTILVTDAFRYISTCRAFEDHLNEIYGVLL